MPGTYHLPKFSRGDDFAAFEIATLTEPTSGDPIAVTSARLKVRRRPPSSAEVVAWDSGAGSITITGAGSNVITLGALAPSVTALFAPGVHDYDLEVVLTATGKKVTLLSGTWEIERDITY